ncbi:LysR family transcriptional regulator, partial [Aliivibrio sifiae]
MSNDIPNFNLLAVFTAVMEQGSLSKAAEYLNTNQSTISTALGRLKKEVGHELFVRSGRGVVPTSYATSLYAEIQGPIQQLNGVFQGFGEFVIVCRKGHPRIKEVLSISQYMDETHAVLERTRNQMYTLGHYTSIDITKRKVAYHGRSMFSNMLLCSQSDYLTAVPLSMALQFEERLQLQVLKPPFESKQISNYLIWLKKLKHDPSHKWFRNELIST